MPPPRLITFLLALAAPPLLAAGVNGEYRFGLQDSLVIRISHPSEPEVKVTVDPSGDIIFPQLGRVHVVRMTPAELEAELLKRLRDGYYVNPTITVSVTDPQSKKVLVLGEAREPGAIQVMSSITLVELITKVGGPTPACNGKLTLIRRETQPGEGGEAARRGDQPGGGSEAARRGDQPGGGSEAGRGGPPGGGGEAARRGDQPNRGTMNFDLASIVAGEKDSAFELRPGDIVHFNCDTKLGRVYVAGHVASPGAYPLTTNMTVQQAIILAGGMKRTGSERRTSIWRKVNGERKPIKATMDALVQDGDTIEVGEAWF